jgi:DNA invertase Pin-like site-specific DNA recombinase
MWQMIGVLSELERSLISERTRAGLKDVRKLIDAGERHEDLAAL